MTTTTERLIEIENEREQTMSDPSFQSWMKDLGVSVVYKHNDSRLRARDMNVEYDFSKLFFGSKKRSYIELLTK